MHIHLELIRLRYAPLEVVKRLAESRAQVVGVEFQSFRFHSISFHCPFAHRSNSSMRVRALNRAIRLAVSRPTKDWMALESTARTANGKACTCRSKESGSQFGFCRAFC